MLYIEFADDSLDRTDQGLVPEAVADDVPQYLRVPVNPEQPFHPFLSGLVEPVEVVHGSGHEAEELLVLPGDRHRRQMGEIAVQLEDKTFGRDPFLDLSF